MLAAVVLDLTAIAALAVAAYVKGRHDGYTSASRRNPGGRTDRNLAHVERIQRQIRSGALRPYDMRHQPWTTVIPDQKEPPHDR